MSSPLKIFDPKVHFEKTRRGWRCSSDKHWAEGKTKKQAYKDLKELEAFIAQEHEKLWSVKIAKFFTNLFRPILGLFTK